MFGDNLEDILQALTTTTSSEVEFDGIHIPDFSYKEEFSAAVQWIRSLSQHNSDRFPIKHILENSLKVKVFLEEMEGELSGYIEKRTDGWHIGINKYEVQGRQRFTLAHELGHLLFHRKFIEEQTKDGKRFEESIKLFRGNDNSKHKENEANTFAAEILMPSKRVREIWHQNTYKELADIFEVSLYAVEYRGRSLLLPKKEE